MKKISKWRAYSCVNGKIITIGYFLTKTQAANAVEEFEKNNKKKLTESSK